ncbi:MAG: hypothetical protein AAGA34_02345 [Pseudomonadota bacterium]
MPAQVDARLAAISARASKANAAFADKLDPTRQLVSAAASSDIETTIWAEAQVGLADLNAHHSEARFALADLDALAATARIAQGNADDIAEISELQNRLALTLDEQAERLAGMNAQLNR